MLTGFQCARLGSILCCFPEIIAGSSKFRWSVGDQSLLSGAIERGLMSRSASGMSCGSPAMDASADGYSARQTTCRAVNELPTSRIRTETWSA